MQRVWRKNQSNALYEVKAIKKTCDEKEETRKHDKHKNSFFTLVGTVKYPFHIYT